jgi:hypothetical protein
MMCHNHFTVSVLAGIEAVAEYSNPTSPAYIHKQMQALEQSRQSYFPSIYETPSPITDAQVREQKGLVADAEVVHTYRFLRFVLVYLYE